MPKKDKTILGISTLDSQLFIVRQLSQQIDIYNTLHFTETGHVTVSDMKDPQSLVACSHYNCLYVSDGASPGYIHRVELFNKSITKWTVKGGPVGLSITTAHNVIVTLYNDKTIQEYSTQGVLLRTISLDDSIVYPCHSIELSTGQFVVCHQGSTDHRVSIVDTQGRIVRSYGGDVGSAAGQLDGPFLFSCRHK